MTKSDQVGVEKDMTKSDQVGVEKDPTQSLKTKGHEGFIGGKEKVTMERG